MGCQPQLPQAIAAAGELKIQWTRKASSDLVRLHDHLKPVAPKTAARVIQQLASSPARQRASAPGRLLDYPRIGETVDAFATREVRRIIVGQYEMRYEIAGAKIFILRLWHCREDRNPDSDA
jgi:plasmid stabilization system protein ParE